MLCDYVVKLHVHCSVQDGDTKSSGSKTGAHSVLRLPNVFSGQIPPMSVGATENKVFSGSSAWCCESDSAVSIFEEEKHWQLNTSMLSLC